jgi:hypothetical protein
MEAALASIVARPWFVLHLGMITADLLWIMGFVSLAATLDTGRASQFAPWLAASALIGGVFDYGVDGYAFGSLAGDWAAASGERKADLLLMAETGLRLVYGTARDVLRRAHARGAPQLRSTARRAAALADEAFTAIGALVERLCDDRATTLQLAAEARHIRPRSPVTQTEGALLIGTRAITRAR